MDATALSVQALNNVNKCQRVEEAKANDLAVHIATHAMLNPERCILIFHQNENKYSSCLLSEVQPAELKEGLIRKLNCNVACGIEISLCGNGLAGIMLPDNCADMLEEDRRTTIMCRRDLKDMFDEHDKGDDSGYGDFNPSPELLTMVETMRKQLKVHQNDHTLLPEFTSKKLHDEDDYERVIGVWRHFVGNKALAFLNGLETHERAEAKAYCGITIVYGDIDEL